MTNEAMAPSSTARPIVALAMGDPAGISPELTAMLLALPETHEAARLTVFGDRRILEKGAREAGAALEMAHRGEADAVCFTPFNKKAMRYAYEGYDDEIRFVVDVTGFRGKVREFNVLEKVWNARVTSHIPLKAVSDHLSVEAILAEVDLTHRCLLQSGIERPRIAVAGLNPHAGDGGSFGMEEIDIIEPAVAAAKAKGFDVEGPFPADTVFLRALNEGYHAVLTMYHDQGQIAMKMMGFDKGVTMMGGLPFPLCTPAHGTAYDIAGTGKADIGATREAFRLAVRMANQQRQLRVAAE
jgi:4-hydroxythreonine-4-phosphate dehydrogenase